MSFEIRTHDGMKVVQWFKDIDELIASMTANHKDTYHRNLYV